MRQFACEQSRYSCVRHAKLTHEVCFASARDDVENTAFAQARFWSTGLPKLLSNAMRRKRSPHMKSNVVGGTGREGGAPEGVPALGKPGIKKGWLPNTLCLDRARRPAHPFHEAWRCASVWVFAILSNLSGGQGLCDQSSTLGDKIPDPRDKAVVVDPNHTICEDQQGSPERYGKRLSFAHFGRSPGRCPPATHGASIPGIGGFQLCNR